MIKSKKIENSNVNVVYDISADGTFVNALGMNVLHNTDGFDFKLPIEDELVEPFICEYTIPQKSGDVTEFDSNDKLCIKNKNNDIKHVTIDDLISCNDYLEWDLFIDKEWVSVKDIEFSEI